MESKSKEDSIIAQSKTFIVEHLDPDLESWSALEYAAIAVECHAPKYKSHFVLSSVSKTLQWPPELRNLPGLTIEHRSVEDLYYGRKERVCLLDPKAEEELSLSDGKLFDAFLFGGILGILPST
jgi:ribosome biogenesis SPOUT family RNA methylase Rps3